MPTLGGGTQHFAGSLALIPVLAQLGYIALTAFVLNVVVATAATFVLRALKTPAGITTIKDDYFAEEGDPRVKPLNEPIHLVAPSV